MPMIQSLNIRVLVYAVKMFSLGFWFLDAQKCVYPVDLVLNIAIARIISIQYSLVLIFHLLGRIRLNAGRPTLTSRAHNFSILRSDPFGVCFCFCCRLHDCDSLLAVDGVVVRLFLRWSWWRVAQAAFSRAWRFALWAWRQILQYSLLASCGARIPLLLHFVRWFQGW